MSLGKFIEARWDNAQEALKARRWPEAQRDARIVAVTLPNAGRALMLCGMCIAPLGLLEEVLAMLQRAHVVRPRDALVLTRLSEALYAAGRFVEAEACVRTALDLGITAGEGYFLLARILWLQGRVVEARKILDMAESVEPGLAKRRRILEYTMCSADFA